MGAPLAVLAAFIVLRFAFCVLLAFPALASAATLNVNSTADTLVAGDGQCTLREAIINAEADSDTTAGDCAAGSGADLINVRAGNHVRAIGGSSLDINSDLTLRGAGAALTVIDAAGIESVVEVWGGVVVIERLTLTGGVLGGIINQFGVLTVRRTVVTNNGAPAIDNIAGTTRIENSTVSGNTAIARFGCLLGCSCGAPPAAVRNASLAYSTIADNLVDLSACGGFPFVFPAAPAAVSADIELRASVLSNPGLANCHPNLSYITSTGHNIDSDGSCGLTDLTDLSNVAPLLGPLQNNGGPTPTHALLHGSPAIDRIPSADCTYDHDGDPLTLEVAFTKDQRNGTRPREGNGAPPSGCDVGAYEAAACADGLDNDGDGLLDFDGGATAGIPPLASPDPNCANALGNMEAAQAGFGCGLGPELAPAMLLLWIGRRRSSPERR